MADVDNYKSAQLSANIANVGIGIGAAAIVGGILVIALAPKNTTPKNTTPKTATTWQITPVVTPGSATLSVAGAF